MASPQRMAAVDTTWLRMDRPTNLMIIVGLLMLAGPVDVARLELTLAQRMLAYPRFRQRVEEHGGSLWWSDDPHFDIAHHIRRVRLPDPAGRRELENLAGELAARPLDPGHPLWQMHVVEQYEGGVALIVRIHHAVADGIALVGVMLSLTDDRPDAPMAPERQATDHGMASPPPPLLQSFLAPVSDALGQGWRLSRSVWRGYLSLLTDPGKVIDYARDGTGIAQELAGLALMANDSPTRFKGVPSGDKRVAWTDPIALPEVKAVSEVLGCSVNDTLLTAVAGALRGYLAEKGDPTDGVEVRALVPINLRPPGSPKSLGNRFGVVAVELPVGLENPLERLYEVHRRMEAQKHSFEGAVTLGLFETLGHAPKAVQDQVTNLLLSRATAVMTNVPGPQCALYLGGARLRQVMFWVPQPGDISMGVSILSFDGQVQFGLVTDAALVPDPEQIVRRFRPEFEKFLYLVLLHPWSKPPSVAEAVQTLNAVKDIGQTRPEARRTRAARPRRRHSRSSL